jgi:protein phosphatase
VEEIEVDTYMRLLPKQGKLLLCSDGLSGLVTDEQIQEIMAQDLTEQEVVDELVNAAMTAGGYDNITGICVTFTF